MAVAANWSASPGDPCRYDAQESCTTEPLRQEIARTRNVKTHATTFPWVAYGLWVAHARSVNEFGPEIPFLPAAPDPTRDTSNLFHQTCPTPRQVRHMPHQRLHEVSAAPRTFASRAPLPNARPASQHDFLKHSTPQPGGPEPDQGDSRPKSSTAGTSQRRRRTNWESAAPAIPRHWVETRRTDTLANARGSHR